MMLGNSNAAVKMEIASEKWSTLITQGAAAFGLTVSRSQAIQFSRHARMLADWNRKINLTAITDPVQVAVKHYLDAIAPLNHIPCNSRLLDIGTGGGFPGIPLKIMRPDQPMTLIDSVRKKITFVKSAIRALGLENIEALHTRAEQLGCDAMYAAKFDVIVCRALADPKAVVRLALPLLAAKGCILIYQGPNTGPQNTADLFLRDRPQRFVLSTVTYQLPLLGDDRAISILKAVDA
jgi:16S rRNA (guanine527-N7)-methyltransferase